MKSRLPLITLFALTISLNFLVAVHADSPAGDAAARTSENFQSSGIRSHGLPIRTWKSSTSTDGQQAANATPSVSEDEKSGDAAWLNSITAQLGANNAQTRAVVGGAALNPITCHNTCTSMTGTISLIPVWVGAWASPDIAKWNSVLGNIVTSLGTGAANSITKPGHVLNTNSLYFTSKSKVAPSLRWVSNTTVTAPTAVSVTDANVATDINTFITANPKIVPTGTTPIYMYIGAKTTRLTSGFGTSYCGWHSYGTSLSLKNVQYLAIQDFTSTYYAACAQQITSPNGSTSLDAMASVLTHEIDETITDPFLNAWYDSYGSENADKCAWTFGTTTTSSGYQYNVQLGSLKYLIQQNWLANNLITATGLSTSSACSITG